VSLFWRKRDTSFLERLQRLGAEGTLSLNLFLTREAAEAELHEILGGEPDCKDVLRVCPDRTRRATDLSQLEVRDGPWTTGPSLKRPT
jgi:hypothetical protein